MKLGRLNHVGVATPSIEGSVAMHRHVLGATQVGDAFDLSAQGVRVLGEPRIGAHGTLIFFLHPKDMGGVLTEIMESPRQAH